MGEFRGWGMEYWGEIISPMCVHICALYLGYQSKSILSKEFTWQRTSLDKNNKNYVRM